MKTYGDFPDVQVPAFLDSPEWSDNSWHNDVYPKSELELDGNTKDTDAVLRVWVAPIERDDREYPDCPRFCVEYISTEDQHTDGTAAILYNGESEELAAVAIRGFLAMRSEVKRRDQESTDLEFMQSVVDVLNISDENATLEYPGFVALGMDGHMSLHCGNVNDCWTADVVDHDGYPIPDAGYYADHISNKTRDVEAVVAWIVATKAEALKAAQ